MLSKEEKLRYGEILRQQMKEREEKKKMEDMEKRGANTKQVPPMREQPVYQSPQIYEKENTYNRPYVDPKEELQKKLESQDYNPFGGSGGGAPNRRMDQNPANMRNMSQPNQIRMGAEEMMEYSNKNYQNPYNNLPQQRVRTMNEETVNYPPQYQQNQMESISPQSINYQRQSENMYQEGTVPSFPQGRMPNPYQQQPILQSTREYPPYGNNYSREEISRQRQPSFDILPESNKQMNSRIQEYQPSNQMMQQSYQPNQNQSYQPTSNQYSPMIPQKSMQQSPYIPTMDQSQPYEEQINENGNEEIQEMYKKGGRNLLKLENETVDEHLIKQKRKLEIQKQLKQQIEEAEKRKKEEKERLKREEELEEKRHLEYLAEQKRRLDEEERKKREEKQRIIDENLRNLEQKKQLEEEAKRKVEQERLEKERKNKELERQKDEELKRQQEIERKRTVTIQEPTINSQSQPVGKGTTTEDDNTSVISSDTSELEKGFNTALSKEFFRKEREKNNPSTYQNKKLEQFSHQIQQINHEMVQQRELMEREIDMMRNEAERAKTDKKKAEEEIEKLKRELKKKMDDENEKLLRALQGNDFRQNDYHQLPPQHYKNLNDYEIPSSHQPSQNQYPTFAKKPLRQKENEHLVRKEFEVEPPKYIPHEEELSQFEQSHVGAMISLDGDSKKIPVYLEHSDKLTMSQVENFAKDSSFFQNISSNNGNRNSPIKQKYNMKIGESIAEEPEEEREYMNSLSRKSNRYKQEKIESTIFKQEKDELDRLIDSRAKSRGGWGEMSSVNSDITKEIEELLRKKENPVGSNNGRPSSISNAGRQSLSKQGYAYDGLTLNSNVGGTLNTNGTVDLERINGRNDARLRELRNLGVETINTNGDDDLNALDQLLNKYK